MAERARLERARPEGRRFSKPVGYLLPNLSELPDLSELPNLSDYSISPKNWRRVGDSNSYAPKLRRFSGPVGHHLPAPSDWWLILVAGYRVERSLRLFRPTLSPDQIQPALSKKLEARRRIELRVSRFADGAVTVSLRALVPEEGIEPPCRSAGS